MRLRKELEAFKKEVRTCIYRAWWLWPDGKLCCVPREGDIEQLSKINALLLSHLNLEVRVTDAKPSETILVPVKKADA